MRRFRDIVEDIKAPSTINKVAYGVPILDN